MEPSPRRPWLAVLLTLLCPGLGHLYCGRIVACLVLFLLSSAVFPAGLAAAVAPPSDVVFAVFIASAAGMAVLAVVAVADAWRSARRAPADFVPREFQRPVVYGLFLAAAFLCPASWAWLHHGRFLRGYVIASGSMAPTLAPGDRVLSNGVRLGYRPLARGDVVTYRVGDGRRTYVKRVVGLPGDRVAVRGGRVIVDGAAFEVDAADLGPGGTAVERAKGGARYAIRLPAASGPATDAAETLVPAGACYVLGDARDASEDSRTHGPVGIDAVTGVVEYRFWSGGDGPIGVVE